MASYLLDKLEELKIQKESIKAQELILQDEIDLEMEKNRRLEMDGTITKLRTQVEELSKNIQGEIMPNNIELNHEKERLLNNAGAGTLQQQIRDRPQITLTEFMDNISVLSEDRCRSYWSSPNKKLVNIPHHIKIYHDIMPIFATMIGLIQKQQNEIAELQNK
jgi:hypothetical protein